MTPVFWLAAAGVWHRVVSVPEASGHPGNDRPAFFRLYKLLDRKYYFDDLYIKGFAAGGRSIGNFLWQKGDQLVIDGMMVNGTARSVGRLAGVLRHIQTGYLYTYAFAMIIGLTVLLGWLIWLR